MSVKKKNYVQRVSIVLHLLSLLLWSTFYMIGPKIMNEVLARNLGLLFMFPWALTSRFSFHNTGLWRFTHTKTKDLDERELEVTNKAIRFSYSVMAITTPMVLYAFFFAKLQLNVVLPFGFLYVAHVMPAVYLGWFGEER